MQYPTDVEIKSHRPVLGRFIVAYKKFVRALIGPYLKSVFEAEHRIADDKFNRVNLRLSMEEDMSRDLVNISGDLVKRMDSIAVLLNQRMDEMDCKYETVHNRVETLNGGGAKHNGIDCLDFENRFRGKREDIKKRLSIYLPVFSAMAPPDYILDIGCGRGEFLELLKESSAKGKGLDADPAMVSYCKGIGLDVEEASAIEYLLNIRDNTLGGVMASHLIEHLSIDALITLAKACHDKLKPGGYLIFETPNPTCLAIFSGAFYVDPTHIRPVHPELARYVLEKSGFGNIEIWFVNQSGDSLSLKDSLDKGLEFINENFKRLNSVLFGAPDYAVIAKKAGQGRR